MGVGVLRLWLVVVTVLGMGGVSAQAQGGPPLKQSQELSVEEEPGLRTHAG